MSEKRFLVIAGDFAPVKDNLRNNIDEAEADAAEFAAKLGEEFHVYERVTVLRPKTQDVQVDKIYDDRSKQAPSETITGVTDDTPGE